jgi:hypothetical protein
VHTTFYALGRPGVQAHTRLSATHIAHPSPLPAPGKAEAVPSPLGCASSPSPEPAGQAAAAALGTHDEISGRSRGARAERYRLQATSSAWLAGVLTPGGKPYRVGRCLRALVPLHTTVAVLAHNETGRARYGHLRRCGSVWTCPVCAAQVTEQRRREIAAAMDLHIAAGGSALMVTLTHSHQRADDLRALIEGERQALARMQSWRAYKALTARLGLVGTIRAREVTYGDAHGWHPHSHEVWLIAEPISNEQRVELEGELFALWHRACAAAGLPAPNEAHGVSVEHAWSPAEYLAKLGYDAKWGSSSELTKAHSKRGSPGRYTPFDLLRGTGPGAVEGVRGGLLRGTPADLVAGPQAPHGHRRRQRRGHRPGRRRAA